jgi:DNA-binding MarR family transcriptional regulator
VEENINYEESILLSVRRIMRAIDMHSSYLARQYGLTSPQLICLKKLSGEKKLTPGGLAKEVHLSHATVTGIINRLEKKELVQRTRSTADGRSYLIRLTDSGLSMIKAAPSMLQDQFMHELSKLAEWEKTMILSSLQRITSILNVESIDAAPVMTTGPVEAPVETITELLSIDNTGVEDQV